MSAASEAKMLEYVQKTGPTGILIAIMVLMMTGTISVRGQEAKTDPNPDPTAVTIGEIGRTVLRIEADGKKTAEKVDQWVSSQRDDREARIKLESRVDELSRLMNAMQTALSSLSYGLAAAKEKLGIKEP